MTSEAGAGHLTSSLSAVELMAALMFSERGFFRYDVSDPEYSGNDRLIFSKGHASPLFYALWAAAGGIDPEELKTFRKFGSRLEGHPTRKFPFTEVPTGSLGQGLGAGVGEALALRKEDYPLSIFRSPYVYVLLGDSEISEGSVWESVAIAAHYGLGNLVAIVDVNRLGQRGETMDGWDIGKIAGKFRAFGWEAVEIEDGHDADAIEKLYETHLRNDRKKPIVFVAKTVKGKGISFLEDQDGWHGKALSKEDGRKALEEIGNVPNFQPSALHVPDSGVVKSALPHNNGNRDEQSHDSMLNTSYSILNTDTVATRKVYGQALSAIAEKYPNLVVLDAEVSNSTYAKDFAEAYPERFFEMFIAEQNMVSCASGMARRGLMPFVSTFGAFFTRALDQIRMAQYANVNITFVGSHTGVSIGDDGVSQMGLEDMAMFRSLPESVVLVPSDAPAVFGCVRAAAEHAGITYIRTARPETPVFYGEEETFPIGGSKMLRSSEEDVATIIAVGVCVAEAMKAYAILEKKGIAVRVIDAYSVKPIDVETIRAAARETGCIITVEDHYPEGGLASAVREALFAEEAGHALDYTLDHTIDHTTVRSLSVSKCPMSGKPEELLHYEGIDAETIVQEAVRSTKR